MRSVNRLMVRIKHYFALVKPLLGAVKWLIAAIKGLMIAVKRLMVAVKRHKGTNNMAEISQLSPEDLSKLLGTFIPVANANLPALGMTAADITLLQSQKTDVDARTVAQKAAQDAAKAATINLANAVKSAKANLSTRNRLITANPAIANTLKVQLGLTVPDNTPSDNTPVAPIDLTVTGTPAGVNTLRWKRGTNKPGVQYVVEAKTDGAATWVLVDAVTATRFDHVNQTPGLPVVYRVRARRRGVVSAASNETTIYG